MSVISKDIQIHWRVVQPLFSIRNKEEYDKAVATLNELIDEVGTIKNTHSMNFLGRLEQSYMFMKKNIIQFLTVTALKCLKYLMEEHQLEPSDLPELGPSNTVLEILEGERDLTIKHIHALSERFQVIPAVFL